MRPSSGPSAERRAGATRSEGRAVEDVVAPGLQVLFCGIDPGFWRRARAGYDFAHPGNRFWKALHRSGLTPALLAPGAERRLLAYGLDVTNLMDRPTPSAAGVDRDELRQGATALAEKDHADPASRHDRCALSDDHRPASADVSTSQNPTSLSSFLTRPGGDVRPGRYVLGLAAS
jgi:hypothetical protein